MPAELIRKRTGQRRHSFGQVRDGDCTGSLCRFRSISIHFAQECLNDCQFDVMILRVMANATGISEAPSKMSYRRNVKCMSVLLKKKTPGQF